MKKLITVLLISLLLLSACEFFIDEDLNKAIKSGDINECLKLTSEKQSAQDARQSECIKEVAVSEEDHSLCEKSPRKDECYEYTAEKFKLPILCEKTRKKEDCYYNYASKTGNVYSCQEITDKNRMETCYVNAASINLDIRTCELIEPQKTKYYECVSTVAKGSGNQNHCELLTNPISRDSCYYDVGTSLNKASACSSIETSDKKDKCYLEIIREADDETICEQRISRSDYKDECYKQLALKRDSQRLCENIHDDKLKQGCLNQFQ